MAVVDVIQKPATLRPNQGSKLFPFDYGTPDRSRTNRHAAFDSIRLELEAAICFGN
jgi:hypothetical protein